MKVWVYYFTFLLAVYGVNAQFDPATFKISPQNPRINTDMTISFQVEETQLQLFCIYVLTNPITQYTYKRDIFTIDHVPVDQIFTYNFKMTVDDPDVIKKTSYLIINYRCEYTCEAKVKHSIDDKSILFLSQPDKELPNVNYVNDNTLIISQYILKTSAEQKQDLQLKLDELLNKKADTNFYLQQAILLSSLYSVTNYTNNENIDLGYLQTSQGQIVGKLENVLSCDNLDNLIFNDEIPPKILSLSSTTIRYQTQNDDIFNNNTLFQISNISECLSIKGFKLLNKLKMFLKEEGVLFKNVTEDYFNSIAYSSSNSLGILNKLYLNTTTSNNDSLVVDENTLQMKNLVEENSLLLSKNNFTIINNDTLKTDNLVFINKKYSKPNNKILRTLTDNIRYESFIINNNFTQINVSLPINYISNKFNLETANIGAVLYKNYPLLSGDNQNYSSNVISLKLYNEIHDIQKVEGLFFPINLIFNRPDPSYQFCLYYNPVNKTWDDKNCKSIEISDTQILCQCNHLTDFTISKFNPINIYDDIVHIIADTNWMTDLEEFKNLNCENAIVLYIYSFLILLYISCLYCTIKYDRSRDCIFNDLTYLVRPKLCDRLCSRKRIVNELIGIKFYADKLHNSHYEIKGSQGQNRFEEIKTNLITTEEIELETNNAEFREFQINLYLSFGVENQLTVIEDSANTINVEPIIDDKSSDGKVEIINSINQNILKFNSVLEIVKRYNIYTSLFLYQDFYKLTKTDALTVIFFSISTSFAICALFSPSNSKSGQSDVSSSGYIFSNRNLAISIITLFIVKIPTQIFKILLQKFKIYRNDKIDKDEKKHLFIKRHLIIYSIMSLLVIWSILNTTWIYLRNYRIERENVFIKYFFTTLLTKILLILIMIFVKTVLLYIILKSSKVPIWKVILITISFIILTLY